MILHVYHNTQLYTYTSPFSFVLTNIKANIQVLCLNYLAIIEKTFWANITFESFGFKT